VPGIDEPRDSPLNRFFHEIGRSWCLVADNSSSENDIKGKGGPQDRNLPDRYLREIRNLPVLSRLTVVFQTPNPIELSRSL
jgi:hypothetical protein